MTKTQAEAPAKTPESDNKPLAQARAEQEQPAGEFETRHEGSEPSPKAPAK